MTRADRILNEAGKKRFDATKGIEDHKLLLDIAKKYEKVGSKYIGAQIRNFLSSHRYVEITRRSIGDLRQDLLKGHDNLSDKEADLVSRAVNDVSKIGLDLR